MFSSAEWFGTEFREFASILVPRNGNSSCILFRRRVRNRIMGVCFYFCSSERNSRVIFSSAEGFRTEFRDFLFRGTTGIPSEITICSDYSVFCGIIFLSEIPNPIRNQIRTDPVLTYPGMCMLYAASTPPTPPHPATCCLSMAWYAAATLSPHFLPLAKCPSILQLKQLAYALSGGLSQAAAAGKKPRPAAPDTEPAPAVASGSADAASGVDYSTGHTRYRSLHTAGTAPAAAHSTAVLPRSSTADRSRRGLSPTATCTAPLASQQTVPASEPSPCLPSP